MSDVAKTHDEIVAAFNQIGSFAKRVVDSTRGSMVAFSAAVNESVATKTKASAPIVGKDDEGETIGKDRP